MTARIMCNIKFAPVSGININLPRRAAAETAGFDIYAARAKVLAPGEYATIPCGFAMSVPKGYEAQIRSRSDLAARSGITVLNSPSAIDPDFRGEIAAILINDGQEDFRVRIGDRVAELIIVPITPVNAHIVRVLDRPFDAPIAVGSPAADSVGADATKMAECAGYLKLGIRNIVGMLWADTARADIPPSVLADALGEISTCVNDFLDDLRPGWLDEAVMTGPVADDLIDSLCECTEKVITGLQQKETGGE